MGAYGSGSDYRDEYAITASGILSSISLPATQPQQYLGGILDQNRIPACVSHDVVKLMKLYWYHRTGVWIDFNPQFLDILSAEDWIPLDGGRRPRNVLKVATNFGCCTSKTLPINTNQSIAAYRNPTVLTPAMATEAAKYKIPGFLFVPKDRVRAAVYLYGAVSTLFQIGEEFWVPSWSPSNTVPIRTPKVVVSGHQMATNGFTPKFNYVENEWSDDWGDYGRSMYDPVEWSPFISENWAIAEIPANVKYFLKSLPSPADFHYRFDDNLMRGMYNEGVKYLQIAYMMLGFMEPVPPEELGIFGPKTAAANGAFQASRKIGPVPGSCGPLTRGELNKIFAI